MARFNAASAAAFTLAVTLLACSDPPASPTPPKALRPVTPVTATGTAGTTLAGGITVQVVDYADKVMEGVKVSFAVVSGDGAVTSRLAVSDAEGLAHTEWTLGQTAGENEVIASTFGVDSTTTFTATGNPGAAVAMSITPLILRIPSSASTGTLAGRVVDQFDNSVDVAAPTYVSRDANVVTVSANGAVTANTGNRGTSTWIVVTGSGLTDSTHVFNLAATDPPCTGITAMADLAVGQVMTTGFVDNGICVPAAAGDRDYALVPFFESPVPNAQTAFSVDVTGIKAPSTPALGALRSRQGLTLVNETATTAAENRISLDRRLRTAERREIPLRAAVARQWFSQNAVATGRRATRAAVVPSVGDQMQLNVEDQAFCTDPSMRTGRVVAVTTHAVVVADLANPAGGFTDADYQSMGVTFDTLVYASDVANFGAPTDIDNNGDRVVLFFTHAVNEIGFGTLGFAYSRDLLPRDGPLGSCPGSNVAELINVYVPDPSNTVASVKTNAVATMGHELQHVINSARRLYVNTSAAPAEERWLNEGLSHVAEELLFFRSTGLQTRQNLGASAITPVAGTYANFMAQNFARYFQFTLVPYTQGPVGVDDNDDDLQTRGAIWSFLRYAADQRFSANEPAFWQSLVNANSTGFQNLTDHIGADVRLVIRDWAMSNYLDDLVPTAANYTQPSWNLRQIASFHSPAVCNLMGSCQGKTVTTSANILLGALSSEFIRFGVAAGQEAYISATGFPVTSNTPLPRHVLLSIVRTK